MGATSGRSLQPTAVVDSVTYRMASNEAPVLNKGETHV